MSEPRHTCDDRCVCPVHDTPLIYSLAADDHACQDITCEYGHGGALDRAWTKVSDAAAAASAALDKFGARFRDLRADPSIGADLDKWETEFP